jgi:ribose 5-phosphate isomerase B
MTDPNSIGIAADHAGYDMKTFLLSRLQHAGYAVTDYGNTLLQPLDDYPDYVIPLAKAITAKAVSRGVAICGSGVGACITGNKINNVRACLIHETFSARQGVEDDNMNLLCLGARVVDKDLAWELTQTFLAARFSGAERHQRRLNKIKALEK